LSGGYDSQSGKDPSGLSHAGRLKFLARDSVVYGGAAAISRAFALITFPLLAQHFSVADYGIIDLFSIVGNFIALLVVFGQDSAIARYFYEDSDPAYRRRIVGQSLLIQAAFALVLLPVLHLFSGAIARQLHDTALGPQLMGLVLLQAPLMVVTNFSINLLKWTFQRTKFLILSLGYVVMNLLLLAPAILFFDLDIVGVFLVALTCQAVFALLGLYFVREWLSWPTRLDDLKPLLVFALPMGVIAGLSAFVPVIERTLVNGLVGESELGIYAVAMRVAGLLTLFIQAFQMAWGPFSLAIHKQADAGRTYSLVLTGFSTMVMVMVLGLSAIAQPLIDLLASNRYAGAGVLVFPLAMGLAVQGIGWITEIGISLAKKSYLHLFSYAAYVAASLTAILLLERVFGLIGIAFGVLVGQVVKTTITTWMAQRAHPLGWPLLGPALVVALGTLLGLLAAAAAGMGLWLGLGAHAAAMVVVLGLAWLLLLDTGQRAAAMGMARRLLNRG